MPNPELGAPGGYYVDSTQTMTYNGLQTSVRKRFSNHYSFDANYTFSKTMATQGGDLAVYSLSNVNNTQDFYDPEYDRGPGRQRSAPSPQRDVHHRASRSSRDRTSSSGALPAAGRCRASSRHVPATRSRSRSRPGIVNSRPDLVPGVPVVLDNWEDTCDATGCSYLNPAAFVQVPVVPATGATTRPGTYMFGDARSRGRVGRQHHDRQELRHGRRPEDCRCVSICSAY